MELATALKVLASAFTIYQGLRDLLDPDSETPLLRTDDGIREVVGALRGIETQLDQIKDAIARLSAEFHEALRVNTVLEATARIEGSFETVRDIVLSGAPASGVDEIIHSLNQDEAILLKYEAYAQWHVMVIAGVTHLVLARMSGMSRPSGSVDQPIRFLRKAAIALRKAAVERHKDSAENKATALKAANRYRGGEPIVRMINRIPGGHNMHIMRWVLLGSWEDGFRSLYEAPSPIPTDFELPEIGMHTSSERTKEWGDREAATIVSRDISGYRNSSLNNDKREEGLRQEALAADAWVAAFKTIRP